MPSKHMRHRKKTPLSQRIVQYFKASGERQWYLFVVLISCLAAGALIYLFEASMPVHR